ncbi:MAG: hypothetical protein QOH49_3328 [Acidobacteriota bacterium]|jgi:hypothetical protein|nr:hypothetical protein [Acidobacteriota bacterium]
MKSNLLRLEPPAAPAAVEQAEPLEAAVRELSARIAENNAERRRLFARLDELRGLTPSLRRKRARSLPLAPAEPVTFSIEEAAAPAPAPLQIARGGR